MTRRLSKNQVLFCKFAVSALYTALVHAAYRDYINPTFEYAHYTYLPYTAVNLAITYMLSCIVILFHRESSHVCQSVAGLIYALCYVPIQLSLLFTVNKDFFQSVLPAQVALALSMSMIFLVCRKGRPPNQVSQVSFKSTDVLMNSITWFSIALILVTSQNHLRFVSFEDVYDLRSISASQQVDNPFLSYLVSWTSYSFISYCFARALVYKKLSFLITSILGCLIIYMSSGSKATLLLLPMTYFLTLAWKDGKNFLLRFLSYLTISIFTILYLIPDKGALIWVKSLSLLRIVGNSGWSASKYFEYFQDNGYTFFTHIPFVNSIFGGYPYKQYSLGQVIGLEYSGSTEANFNASFWASDGFAAIGVLGILLVTVPLIVLLYTINCTTYVFDSKFTVAWLSGFFVALLNVPLTTACFSGGGLIILLISWRVSKKCRRIACSEEV